MTNVQLSELNPYQRWQLEKYGNIIPDVEYVPAEELLESGIEELNRLSEWMETQHEKQVAEQQFETQN